MVSLSIWSLIYSRLPIYLYLYCSLLFDLAREPRRVACHTRDAKSPSLWAQLSFDSNGFSLSCQASYSPV